jgi:glycosyltransferase
MNKRDFSVVIPNYNDVRIYRTLESIANQKHKNIEVIIVDGNSTNKDVDIVYDKYKSIIDILIKEPDKGIFDALNKGIKASSGKYILLMGADDKLSDAGIFSDVFNLIQSNENLTGVCIECHFTNSHGKVVRKWVPSKITKNRIKWGLLPPHFSLFLNKDVYSKLGLFDISEGNIGLDSKWLLKLWKIDNLNIPILKGHSVLMELGGTSTGSIRNILIAYKKIALEARKLKYKNWFILPLIKILSKTPQFLIK